MSSIQIEFKNSTTDQIAQFLRDHSVAAHSSDADDQGFTIEFTEEKVDIATQEWFDRKEGSNFCISEINVFYCMDSDEWTDFDKLDHYRETGEIVKCNCGICEKKEELR